ncbi:MAG: auracyanin family protein, partial [Planctomycetota bacterium]
SPAGLEIAPWGDVFYTDNQGEWCGTNKLCHIEEGDYFGHTWGVESAKLPISRMKYPGKTPDGLTYVEAKKKIPDLKLPAIWFPYNKMGKSAAGMLWDTTGGDFGPFQDQLFVADQHHASVMRVDLEQVAGVWQGAAMRFREGLSCGALRLAWGDENVMLIGQTSRGWGSVGKKSEGLEYLRWTGKVPCEVLTCRSTSDGYKITFTMPMERSTLEDVSSYSTENYTYKLHSPYGSPEVDRAQVTVDSAVASADGKSVTLKLAGSGAMRIGYVTEIILAGVRSAEGEKLLHPEVYATLNRKPGE